MKLQYLIIIFCLIIVPITLLLSSYISAQVDTITLQTSYDEKLMRVTHDAVIAYQKNTVNNQNSDLSDTQRKDIQAAIQIFKNSAINAFGISGGETALLTYVPAIAFTMNDGLYIYSPYSNGSSSYKHTLKPYIKYSAHYVGSGTDKTDVVITYSLNNYITIVGIDPNGNFIDKEGYLVNTGENGVQIEGDISNPTSIKFKGIPIKDTEETGEYFLRSVSANEDGTLSSDVNWRSDGVDTAENSLGKQYYIDAYKFTTELKELFRTSTAELKTEKTISSETITETKLKNILNFSDNNNPEDGASVFGEHKIQIIKFTIQDNLNTAISNYNRNSSALGTTYNFEMPIFTPQDWELVFSNISMITFIQGFPIGSKMYNNYAIVNCNINKDYINEESMYFVDDAGEYHKITCKKIKDGTVNIVAGYLKRDFERLNYQRKITITKADGTRETIDAVKYYYKHNEYACYDCIIMGQTNVKFEDLGENIKSIFYTSLGRLRQKSKSSYLYDIIDSN